MELTGGADVTTYWTKRQRRVLKFILIVLGFAIGLAIAEITLRIVGYSYPSYYILDERLGYKLRPGMEGWYRKEGESYVRINSDGFRDREHTKEKPANTVRIAVFGDSYTEAFHVPQEQVFWSVMQQRLLDCQAFGRKNIEVINFGVSGYGTAQELIMLRDRVWAYAPDIVMLAVTTNTDVADNSRQLHKIDQIPYFILRNGELVLDDSFVRTRTFRLRQSALGRLGTWIVTTSRVIQVIAQAHTALKYYLATRRALAKAPSNVTPGPPQSPTASAPTEELGINNLIYREPGDLVWNDAWGVTETLMRTMHEEVKSRGAKFVVVTLSNAIQVFPQPAVREAFMKRVGVTDVFYPDHRIGALCEREGIAVITLAPELQKYADENRAFLHGFGKDIGNGHWNSLGHRVAGEMIAAKLCRF